MRTYAGKDKALLLSIFLLLALAACAPGAGKSSSSLSNVPSGSGATPEAGTNGAAQPRPNGHSESLIVSGDLAFVGSDNQALYALGTQDGKVHWQYQMGDTVWVYAVANGAVYAVAGSVLYALKTDTGALLWKSQATEQLSTVLVSAGVVYASTAATGNVSNVLALDAATGATLWQHALITVTPALQGALDGVAYAHQESGDPGAPGAQETIFAFRGSDGQTLWQTPLAGANDLAEGEPVAANGLLYFATSAGGLYALDAATGRVRWQATPTTMQPFAPMPVSPVVVNGLVFLGDSQGITAYRASDGARQWQYTQTPLPPFVPQPVVADGVLYADDLSGLVVALRASDGSVVWQQHMGGAMSPLVVDAGLLISDAGPVVALRASDGSIVWQSALTPTGEGVFFAGPAEAVNAGEVYLGGDDGMVTTLQASSGHQLWQYAIKELPVQEPPVYYASVTFAPKVTYQQALEDVTNLGLKTFAVCSVQWAPTDEQVGFSDGHQLEVAAAVNSAPLWLDRLQATAGVTTAAAFEWPLSCPKATTGGLDYLPSDQAGTFVQATFTSATTYAEALDRVNALGFRLADPCYEQARAQGQKPTWHPMGETDAFATTHALVLATTPYNAMIWASQLRGIAGFVKSSAPFKAAC